MPEFSNLNLFHVHKALLFRSEVQRWPQVLNTQPLCNDFRGNAKFWRDARGGVVERDFVGWGINLNHRIHLSLLWRPELFDSQSSGDDFGGHAKAPADVIRNESQGCFTGCVPLSEAGVFSQ